MNKKIIIILVLATIVLMPLSGAFNLKKPASSYKSSSSISTNSGYINITVHEAYDMLICTCDGIQKPIDIRRIDEWKKGRINTPSPEDPELWTDLHLGVNIQDFMNEYAGKDLVIYCRSSNRSWTATKLLIDSGFTGTIYHMLGGINAWKEAGYPVKKIRSCHISYAFFGRIFEKFPNISPIIRSILNY